MHSLRIIHRDLRPEKILIDEDGHIKIVDFGYAMKMTSNTNCKLYTICCLAPYLSPELLKSKYQGGYGKEVDLWAFAVALYEMMVGHTPFTLLSEDLQYEIFLAILESRIQYPTFLESSAKELLKDMFVPEIDKRLKTVQGVKEHGYFTKPCDV